MHSDRSNQTGSSALYYDSSWTTAKKHTAPGIADGRRRVVDEEAETYTVHKEPMNSHLNSDATPYATTDGSARSTTKTGLGNK